MIRKYSLFVATSVLLTLLCAPYASAQEKAYPASADYEDTYDEGTVQNIANDLFGETSEGLAKVIQKIFADLGRPNAYIAGSEGSGAIVIGLRYGKGELNHKRQGKKKIFWTGPSVGFDLGGNASKVFTLIYNLKDADKIYRRFPAGEGLVYFVAGFGVNYQQRGKVIIAPIRTGVGWRLGVNLGYMKYSRKRKWLPL